MSLTTRWMPSMVESCSLCINNVRGSRPQVFGRPEVATASGMDAGSRVGFQRGPGHAETAACRRFFFRRLAIGLFSFCFCARHVLGTASLKRKTGAGFPVSPVPERKIQLGHRVPLTIARSLLIQDTALNREFNATRTYSNVSLHALEPLDSFNDSCPGDLLFV
jgi:hypothetical protein